jgi:hypothetical protein
LQQKVGKGRVGAKLIAGIADIADIADIARDRKGNPLGSAVQILCNAN